MTNLFLLNDDVNVIAIDWGGGSVGLYSQSAANTRLVGLEVAALINYLIIYKNAKLQDFHIVGHSLGAHIAGYAGEKLISMNREAGKLGRITALDPAQPLFQNTPEFVRLDPGDADFVDVIHTDAKSILMGGMGMESPCGHIDFYPNGGYDQPGCSLFDMPVSLDSMVDPDSSSTAAIDTMGRHLVACSHNRGIELYIESLQEESKCHFIGHECESDEKFQDGLCFDCGLRGEKCAVMGEKAINYKAHVAENGRKHVRLFLNTGKKSPFCQHHYLLEFNLAQPAAAERWVQGFLKVNLYGTESEITDVDLTPKESLRLTHGARKSFVLAFSQDLGSGVRLVNVEWRYDHDISLLDPLKVCVLLLCSDSVYMQNVSITSISLQSSRRIFIPNKSSAINSSGALTTTTAAAGSSKSSLMLPISPKMERTVVCGDLQNGYSTIKSGGWKLFYKEC